MSSAQGFISEFQREENKKTTENDWLSSILELKQIISNEQNMNL